MSNKNAITSVTVTYNQRWVNFLKYTLMILIDLVASRQERGGVEAQSIEEICNFAWSQVSSDIDEVKQNISEFKESVVKIKSSVDSLVGGDAFGIK